jgi:hypothetical protein
MLTVNLVEGILTAERRAITTTSSYCHPDVQAHHPECGVTLTITITPASVALQTNEEAFLHSNDLHSPCAQESNKKEDYALAFLLLY